MTLQRYALFNFDQALIPFRYALFNLEQGTTPLRYALFNFDQELIPLWPCSPLNSLTPLWYTLFNFYQGLIPLRYALLNFDQGLIPLWPCLPLIKKWLTALRYTLFNFDQALTPLRYALFHFEYLNIELCPGFLAGALVQWLKLPAWKVGDRGFKTRLHLSFKETKCYFPLKYSILWGACVTESLASDRQGSNFESCVWRAVLSHSSHHPQEVLLAQFSLYWYKGGLKPYSFHLISLNIVESPSLNCHLQPTFRRRFS